MNQQSAPAGWYDDPAGSGGQRLWNGTEWTQQVRGADRAASAASRTRSAGTPARRPNSGRNTPERIPDGYIMLNGKQVPITSATIAEAPVRAGWKTALVFFLVVAAIVGALAIWAVSSVGEAFESDGGATVTATSDDGSPVMVQLSTGDLHAVDSGWSTDTDPSDLAWVSVDPTTSAAIVSCSITIGGRTSTGQSPAPGESAICPAP